MPALRPTALLSTLAVAQVTGMCLTQERHEFTLNGLRVAVDPRTGGCPVSAAGGTPGRG